MEKFSTLGLAEAQPAQPIVENALRAAKQHIEDLHRQNEFLRVKADAFDALTRLTRVNYGGECSTAYSSPWFIDDALYEIERAKNENGPGENIQDLDASDLAPAGDDGDQTDEITLFKEAMGEFCNKVEAGQIKSRHTYVKFCRLLGRLINMDDIASEEAQEGDMVRFDVALDNVQWPGQPAPATKA